MNPSQASPYAFVTFATAEAVLEQFWPTVTPRVAYTTEHVQQFLAYAGMPQDSVPAIHIAGTSGKTSTAYYAAALLQAAGKRVGLLTSPHITNLAERVQINLQPLPEAEFCTELSHFMNLVAESGITLTYAEILYAFGFWEFARQRVEYMVIEVGLGGTLDATNVMTHEDKICVITDIGYDHTHILGRTLPEITRNKAGIVLFHNAVFCYQQAPEIMQEIEAAARRKHADLQVLSAPKIAAPFRNLPLFQQRNSYLALQAVQAVLRRDGLPSLRTPQLQAAAAVHIPGRMEVTTWRDKTIILDGAHNAQKIAALAASIRQRFPEQPVAVLVASIVSKSRDADELFQALQPFVSHGITTTLPAGGHHRWRTGEELAPAAQVLPSHEHVPSLEGAVRALLSRPEAVLVITGSFYLLQPARQALQNLGAIAPDPVL